MAERISTELRVVYLLVVVTTVCFLPAPAASGFLLLVQIGLWMGSGVSWRPLARMGKRLSVFFLVIAVSYAFVSVGEADRWTSFVIGSWKVGVNLGGLAVAAAMCLRVFVLVAASVWVQESGKPGDFVRAMERFHVPRFLAASIDGTIQLASGAGGGGSGGGGGHGQAKRQMGNAEKVKVGFEQLRQGKLTFVIDMVEGALARAERFIVGANPDLEQGQAKDIAVIVGTATAIMGTKVFQVLPGLPFAPGHKNVIVIPLLLLAAGLTRAKFGGLWAGVTAGVVSVLSGYGSYGVLEVLHFAVPGLMADILLPLARIKQPRWLRSVQFAIVGAALGLGRFAANFLMILLAGAPGLAFVLYVPMLVSQMVFGALSAFVTLSLLDLLSRESAAEGPGVSLQETRVEADGGGHAGRGDGTGGGGRRLSGQEPR